MVEIVFEEVVFGEIGDVGVLDPREIVGRERADIHGGFGKAGVRSSGRYGGV